MNRIFWIDLVRVVCAFFVVAIHVCGRVAGGYAVEGGEALSGTLGYLVARCMQELSSNVAVPLFVMVSGALLLGRSEETIPFYRKRFGKILLPFFGWSCIFIFCLWLSGRGLGEGTPVTLLSAVGAILSGNVSGHFWFMYMLISLYLVAPFLSAFVRNASKNMLTCFLVLWFFAALIFPIINHVAKETLGITGINSYFRFELVSYWVGFFVAGYVLKDVVIPHRWAVLGIALWFFLGITVPVSSYLLVVCPGPSMLFLVFAQKYIFSIISHQMTMSLIAFLVLRSLGDLPSLASSRFGRMVIATAPLTFGIYLCHHLILTPTMGVLQLGSCESWLIVFCAIPTLTVLFYFLAAGPVYLLHRSRYLRFLAP